MNDLLMRFFLKNVLFSGGERVNTWRKMAVMLKYEQTLNQILQAFHRRRLERKSPLAKIFEAVLNSMNKGQSLDSALADWIPQEETMLIRAGVLSNKIPESLENCADLIEARSKIVGGIIGAVAYPSVLLAMLIFFILFQAFYVMPEIATLSDPRSWDGAAALLYSLTDFIASPLGLAVFVSALILAALALGTMPFWTGKWRLRVEKLPPWSVYRMVVGSVWLFTVATLLRGGTQMEQVFDGMLKSGALSPWLAERVAAIKNRYRSEGDFGQILLHLGMHFPDDELVEDLAVYATMPKFDETLYKISREWLADGVKRIDKTARILNVILMLAIVFMTAWMAFAIRSLQEQLVSGMGGF